MRKILPFLIVALVLGPGLALAVEEGGPCATQSFFGRLWERVSRFPVSFFSLFRRDQPLRGQLLDVAFENDTCRVADVDRSGSIDIADLSLVGRRFGQAVSGVPEDVNKDGVVDITDLVSVGRGFGQTCGAPGVSGGRISVSLAPFDNEIAAGIILAGREAVLGKFAFTAIGEDMTIRKLQFLVTPTPQKVFTVDSTDEVSQLKLYDGNTQIGNGCAVATFGNQVGSCIFDDLHWNISKDSRRTLTVRGVIGKSFKEGSGASVYLHLLGNDVPSSEFEALGRTTRYTSISSVSANEKVVFWSRPLISVLRQSGVKLGVGETPVLRFRISADPAGDISWKKIQFRISMLGADMSAVDAVPGTRGNIKIKEITTNRVLDIAAASSDSSSIIIGQKLIPAGTSGFVTLVLKDSQIISAGSFRDYEFFLTFSKLSPVAGTAGGTFQIYQNDLGAPYRGDVDPVSLPLFSFLWSDMSAFGYSTATDGWISGRYVSGLPSEIVTIDNGGGGDVSIIPGDVDKDGKFTCEDVYAILQFGVGTRTLTADEIRIGDVSGDGKLGGYDAGLLMQRANLSCRNIGGVLFNLKQGLNFISFGGEPRTFLTSRELLQKQPFIQKVCEASQELDTPERTFSNCHTREGGSLITFQSGRGYLVHASQDFAFSSQHYYLKRPFSLLLKKGLNSIGIPNFDDSSFSVSSAKVFLSTIYAEKIYRVRPGTGWEFVFKIPGRDIITGTDFPLRPSEGYVVSVPNDVLWKFDEANKNGIGFLLGDADMDGRLTCKDPRLILKHSVGLIASTPADMERLDVDGNGRIASVDAAMILRRTEVNCNHDYNEDNTIDAADVSLLEKVVVKLASQEDGRIYDINGDGKLDALDPAAYERQYNIARPFPRGDVDGDGTLACNDLTFLSTGIFYPERLTAEQWNRADLYPDGEINAYDISFFTGPSDCSNSNVGTSQIFQVWPGDTNNDGIVDERDILLIGMHFGLRGFARNPISSEWKAWNATVWTKPATTYADANGDGVVDEKDRDTVALNWRKTRN